MTTHHECSRDDLVAEHVALLAQATETVADPQVRHRGTLGGALAHADPAGDLGAAALALDAEMVIAGPVRQRGPWRRRTSSWTTSPPRSARARSSPRSGSRSTPAGAPTTRSSTGSRRPGRSCAVAAAVRVEGGTIAEARVGLTNMGPTPIRATGGRAGAGRPAGHGRGGPGRGRARGARARPPPSDADAAADYRGTWPGCSPAARCSAAAG